ncbi:MAG: NADH-quinone oxidoreductase subunit L [Planctomycetes bacterium]|nr:NADH-quinone oxidoreductase subunit L [Planctomycetota bacterium]
MDPGQYLPMLLGLAVFLPLGSFFVILVFGPRMGKAGEHAASLATAAIGSAAILSFASLAIWLSSHRPGAESHGEDHASLALPRTNIVVRGQEPDAGDHEAEEHAHVEASSDHESNGHGDANDHAGVPIHYTGDFNAPGIGGPWVLGEFGKLRLSVSYYIDSLTVCMFCMVTFIATLIHIYAMGYMQEELDDVTDHEVTTSDGEHLHRPGRYHRFFQYLSLFCFSMLGLVIAGNIAMVFVFWELVGVCSYFLIGFYVERKSASNAANKAFIVNRVGDFGMILGLLALWTGLGTFSFGDYEYVDTDGETHAEVGIFTQVREAQTLVHGDGHGENRRMAAPDGMVRWTAQDEIGSLVRDHQGLFDSGDEAIGATDAEASFRTADWRKKDYGYGLLVLAGVGIFCGCVGKSAQFPLHVWLPDAMEGPTPVSALVHSATMVAAGVYLVGRFYPAFTPEVLLIIAVAGVITLFMAATIAITATDIKRVLAYSTVSQLGYMMMALGVGGWLAGMMHLITHAFFKSLLFMGSGSVIHAVHTNEMSEMGGLRKKMPVTAYTMLVGCLAIAGAGVPFIMSLLATAENHEFLKGVGFSGFYSKDAILEQAYSFMQSNDSAFAGVFFLAAAGGAAITAFYMFRMWYLTFAGEPRNQERYDHAHESPPTMYAPLIILAVMAIGVAWSPLQGVIAGTIATLVFFVRRIIRSNKKQDESSHAANHGHAGEEHHEDEHHHHDSLPTWLGELPWALSFLALAVAVIWTAGGLGEVTLAGLLGQANPVDDHVGVVGVWLDGWTWPAVHAAHEASVVVPVSLIAIGTAFTGFLLATMMYGLGYLDPAEVRSQFQAIYRFLLNKWWFDELYDRIFIRPTHLVSGWISGIDRNCIDRLIDGLASITRWFSTFWAWLADQTIVDGFIDWLAARTHSLGLSLRAVQTGRIRQYVMFIVIGAVAIFILISFFWNPTLAG